LPKNTTSMDTTHVFLYTTGQKLLGGTSRASCSIYKKKQDSNNRPAIAVSDAPITEQTFVLMFPGLPASAAELAPGRTRGRRRFRWRRGRRQFRWRVAALAAVWSGKVGLCCLLGQGMHGRGHLPGLIALFKLDLSVGVVSKLFKPTGR
jgi:hypothetical protein